MKETKFELYELKPFIIDAVHRLGFYEPTDIQKRLIPAVLKRKRHRPVSDGNRKDARLFTAIIKQNRSC